MHDPNEVGAGEMTAHDPMCLALGWVEADERCDCDRVRLIRADERVQVGRVWAKREDLLLGDIEVARADERAALNGKLLHLYTQNAHAEAVAARLVEVVCEDAEALRHVHAAWRKTNRGYIEVENERDAARAEVLDLNAEVERLRQQVAALRKRLSGDFWNAVIEEGDIRREVLADLRAWVGTHAFDYTEWDTGVSKCRHADHKRSGWSATCPKAWVRKELPHLIEEGIR